jgi:hypothetical protein
LLGAPALAGRKMAEILVIARGFRNNRGRVSSKARANFAAEQEPIP